MPDVDALLTGALSVVLILTLAAALVLTTLSLRAPRVAPLAVAGALLVCDTVLAAAVPVAVPLFATFAVAGLAIAVAVLGGNPVTRLVLDTAAGGRVRETPDGGILLRIPSPDDGEPTERALLRGGTTIGYLERLAVAVSIIAGFPEAIAVVVAVKGVGRFSELATSEARERFIVGTLASLIWAGLAGGVARLAGW